MSKPVRMLLIVAAVIGGMLLASGALLPLYLSSAHAGRLLREAVNRRIPGSVTWDELTFLFPEGALAVTGAVLHSPEGEETARVERAYLDVVLPALLFRRIRVSELFLVRPVVRADLGEGPAAAGGATAGEAANGMGGARAIPALLQVKEWETGGRWRLRLERLEVRGGSLVLVTNGIHLDTGPFDLELGPGPRRAESALLFSTRGGYLGAGDFGTLFSADLRARVAGGEVKDLRVDAQARRGGAVWSYVRLEGDLDFSDALNAAPGTPGGLLELCSYRFTLQVERMLLGELFPSGGAAGEIAFTASGSGRGFTPNALSARARLDGRLEEIRAGGLSSPPGFDLHAEARMQNGVLTLERLRLEGGGAVLAASGSYAAGARTLQGAADFQAEELKRVLRVPGGPGPEGALMLSLLAEGGVGNPSVTARLYGERAGYGGFAFGRIMAEAELEPSGLLAVSELLLEREGGTVSGGGRVRLFEGAPGRPVPDPPLHA
ncbi:MAG: hypothetical protein ACOC8N_05010, partial [Spirochaetota bacterium]